MRRTACLAALVAAVVPVTPSHAAPPPPLMTSGGCGFVSMDDQQRSGWTTGEVDAEAVTPADLGVTATGWSPGPFSVNVECRLFRHWTTYARQDSPEVSASSGWQQGSATFVATFDIPYDLDYWSLCSYANVRDGSGGEATYLWDDWTNRWVPSSAPAGCASFAAGDPPHSSVDDLACDEAIPQLPEPARTAVRDFYGCP